MDQDTHLGLSIHIHISTCINPRVPCGCTQSICVLQGWCRTTCTLRALSCFLRLLLSYISFCAPFKRNLTSRVVWNGGDVEGWGIVNGSRTCDRPNAHREVNL